MKKRHKEARKTSFWIFTTNLKERGYITLKNSKTTRGYIYIYNYITRKDMKRKFRVLLPSDVWGKATLERILGDIAEIIEKELTKEKLREEIKKEYDVIIDTIWLPITASMIQSASSTLKVIGTSSVGVDHIDIEAAEKRGIKVVNGATNGICASAYSVAEHAFALLLSVVRKTYRYHEIVKTDACSWKDCYKLPIFKGIELFGKTLGIIGVGRIGSHIARIGRGFRMKIIGFDPYVDKEKTLEDDVFIVDDLKQLLAESDVIAISACLTKETKKMIGESEISMMKNGVYIVNVSRGMIVEEHAIIKNLKSSKIAGYAADVLWNEPGVNGNSPIFSEFKKGELNISITPHIAFLTDKAPERYPRILGNRIREILTGEKYLHDADYLKIPSDR